jgi:predicted transcriptional regulator
MQPERRAGGRGWWAIETWPPPSLRQYEWGLLMEVHFNTDLQTKVNRLAAENQSEAAEYVQQLVEHYVDHDGWFREKVKSGLAQLDRGEYLTNEEVAERIKRAFPS